MKKPRIDWRPWIFLIGFGSLCYGIWLVHQPSAFIAGGGILCALAAVATARGRR